MIFSNLNHVVKSGLLTNNLEEKKSLNEKQNRRLRSDVESVLSYREWIKTITNNNFDITRILGVVAVTKGAEYYLPYTIPKIIKQISEIGMMADIFIGLNNGFECQSVIERFSLIPNVQVIHLYTKEKIANNIPAKIFDNASCEGEPYNLSNLDSKYSQHRIFVVHQKEGEFAAGKIRVLGDIYSLLLRSIENGWIPPATLLTFDAESMFLVEENFSLIDPESNGLMLLISELQKHPELAILGTRDKFTVYQKEILDGTEVLLPNFSEEVPPIQWFLNIVHGRYSGYQWLPGGGTVGRTDVLISMFVVISLRYPGTRIEDTQLTVIANYAGLLNKIFKNVIYTNRTPSLTDMTIGETPKKAWLEQVSRWNAGFHGLKLCYGKHNLQLIMTDSFPWAIFPAPIEFLKNLMGRDKVNFYTVFQKIKVLAIAFSTSRNIKKKSLENPDILQGSKTKASW
ncbi:MAG: hypothetical protein C6Y22_21410 [Hapalosiphonaceae cyanobacterium JJU2]|nr:MAG: hypothetical protein C6Y22_21410 [Hapalosiphonaceae cyanobacterium JJU2]